MFRILIVEDDPGTCRAAASTLRDAMGELHLDIASYEDEAIELVRLAVRQRWPYDAALIDFQLPDPVAGGFRMALSICKLIMKTMPRALVLHVSGFLGDPLIKAHIAEMNLQRVGPKELDFPKTSGTYDIVKAVKAHLHGEPIRRQLDELFGGCEPDVNVSMAFLARVSSPTARSVTHRIAALTRDITAHWDDLPEDLRDRIHTIFYVDPVTHKASLTSPLKKR